MALVVEHRTVGSKYQVRIPVELGPSSSIQPIISQKRYSRLVNFFWPLAHLYSHEGILVTVLFWSKDDQWPEVKVIISREPVRETALCQPRQPRRRKQKKLVKFSWTSFAKWFLIGRQIWWRRNKTSLRHHRDKNLVGGVNVVQGGNENEWRACFSLYASN